MSAPRQFLVGIGWSDPEEVAAYKRVGLDDDPRCSTGLFVTALSPEAALEWANSVAIKFVEYRFRGENYSIESLEVFCWLVENPERSSWNHCLGFFQTVAPGDLPDFDKMTSEAYSDWSKRNGLSQ